MSSKVYTGNPEEPWAGDKDIQMRIARAIMKDYSVTVHPIDLAGACETVLANLVNGFAASREEALDAIDAVCGDMKETIERARAN